MLAPKVKGLYLTNYHFTIDEKIEASQKFTLDDYKEELKTWLKELRSIWLIQGQITKDQALDIVNQIEEEFLKPLKADIKYNFVY